METLRFKTNLKCSGCIAAISPGMNKISGITDWKVDLNQPDRILEVNASSEIKEDILIAVKKAGYEISQL
jgi:copper chaperone